CVRASMRAADLEAQLSAQRYAVKDYFPAAFAGWTVSVALELEGDTHLGAIGFDFSLVELHVQFDDLGNPQVPQCLACPFHGGFGRLLPGLGAGSDQRDDFVNGFGHVYLP